MADRQKITRRQIRSAIVAVRGDLKARLKEKGLGAFVSRHEILGVITDEYTELIEAVQTKAPISDVRHDLLDIIVGGIFAVACIDAEALDW